MIRGFLNTVIWCVGAAVIAYVVFTVPLGERTMFEHLARIWETPEAQDMRSEVRDAASRAKTEMTARITESSQSQTAAQDQQTAPTPTDTLPGDTGEPVSFLPTTPKVEVKLIAE